jgi:hypothetical protein
MLASAALRWTGSAALGREGRWSDIDLALCVVRRRHRAQVVADWTDVMYGEHGAVHHLDVSHGETVYRVFLLLSTLQVDISFRSPAEFGVAAQASVCCLERPRNRRPELCLPPVS